MKKLVFPWAVLFIIAMAGCGGDDNGNGSNGNGPTVLRVIVDTTVTAPTLAAVDEAMWFLVDSFEVKVGENSLYGLNPVLGQRSVWMKAIKKDGKLYLWAKWRDANATNYADYVRTINEFNNWERVTFEGEDILSFIFDFQNNGDEMADCASMCHLGEGIMKTTGGGQADIWKWMAAKTAPAMMAEDKSMDGSGTEADPTLNEYPYRENFHLALPIYMHPDTTEFNGRFLYLGEVEDYDNSITWPFPFNMPGYVIDSTIFNDVNRTQNSRNDVRAIAHFDSTGLDVNEYTWTVVYERALATGHADDVDLSGLDSIMVTLAVTHNARSDAHVNHSGSEPFWIILKP